MKGKTIRDIFIKLEDESYKRGYKRGHENGCQYDYEHLLTCQHCGYNYTHHEEVACYAREDCSVGVRTRVRSKLVVQDTDISDNPSPRRNGVSISYSCEGCGKTSRINIYQHKGQTFVSTEKSVSKYR
ncbi:MAG: hypothetical protein JW913_16795 [Chitinispirillaceae bacterium]|nr:hypothetical protein [Chitinispirillaceae bacterium]